MLSFRRRQMWLLAGALLVLGVPAQAAEVDKLLPGDTEVVAVVNVKQILDAPLVKKHLLDKAKDVLKANDEVSKVMEALGFDPLKDLTSITVGLNGVDPDAKGIVIAHGQFDTAKFAAKAEEVAKQKGDFLKIHKDGGQTIYEVKNLNPNEDKPMFVALIDNATIAAGNEIERVQVALATAAGKKSGKVKKELQELIEKMDANQSIWVVVPGSGLAKNPLAADEKAKKSLEKIESISLGVTITKDVKLSIGVMAKSADNAKELAEEIKDSLNQAKGLVAVLAQNMEKLNPVVDLVNSIKVTTDGKTVALKGEASEELIEKALKKD
jgi:ArsR family metal-binding transcriptional regulator